MCSASGSYRIPCIASTSKSTVSLRGVGCKHLHNVRQTDLDVDVAFPCTFTRTACCRSAVLMQHKDIANPGHCIITIEGQVTVDGSHY